jgi:intraflagellar transport protein 122
MKACGKSAEVIRAFIYAYSRRFREAARLLQEAGNEQTALEMFADLRMFDQAQEFLLDASEETQKSLLRKKADWAHSSNDLQLAAEMLIASGDYDKAIKIMIDNDWTDKVLQLANRLDRSDANLIREIGKYLETKEEFTVAATLYNQIGDIRSIALMHTNAEHWEDAFVIVERHKTLASDVYLPYARWLSEKDMFDEAQIAYGKAGHDNEAFEVLQQLAEKAVLESRFLDASCYFRTMAHTYLSRVYSKESDKSIKNRINEAIEKADIYYAYDSVFRYVVSFKRLNK